MDGDFGKEDDDKKGVRFVFIDFCVTGCLHFCKHNEIQILNLNFHVKTN